MWSLRDTPVLPLMVGCDLTNQGWAADPAAMAYEVGTQMVANRGIRQGDLTL